MNAKKLLHNPDYLFFLLSLFIYIFYLLNSDFVYISFVTFSHFFIFSIVFFFSFRFFSIFLSSITTGIKPFLPAYVLFIFLALLLALISTTKIFLFVIVFYLLFFSKVNMLRILTAMIVLLALFFLSHLLLEKFSSNPDDGVFRALWNTLLVYMFGGVAAFQNILIGSVQLEPNIMLTSIKGIVSVFGIDNVPVSSILPWSKVGNWNTNVYTAFGYWYSLMGNFYLFISPLILGLYYALFFSPQKTFIMFDFYKPFLLFCLTFIYMGDQYLPAFLMHFIYIFISIIVSITKVEEERN